MSSASSRIMNGEFSDQYEEVIIVLIFMGEFFFNNTKLELLIFIESWPIAG